VGHPCAPDELLPPASGGWTWDSPLVHAPNALNRDAYERGLRARLEPLAAAAGCELNTYRDALDALLNLGLLATLPRPASRLVSNPAPPAAWDTLHPLPLPETAVRASALSAYGHLARDIEHLVAWAPDRVLRASPLTIAVRLAVPVPELIGALRLLVLRGYRLEPPDLDALDPAAPISITTEP
jgi:hypothetical protein